MVVSVYLSPVCVLYVCISLMDEQVSRFRFQWSPCRTTATVMVIVMIAVPVVVTSVASFYLLLLFFLYSLNLLMFLLVWPAGDVIVVVGVAVFCMCRWELVGWLDFAHRSPRGG